MRVDEYIKAFQQLPHDAVVCVSDSWSERPSGVAFPADKPEVLRLHRNDEHNTYWPHFDPEPCDGCRRGFPMRTVVVL